MNKLITNNQTTNFYNHITKLLLESKSFIFNVAFINFSGVQLLLDVFSKLENKNIKGKILTSTYLNFTQIKALEKLKEFSNIELKIYDCNESNIGFHAKSYIFEFEDFYEVIVGSSNITASAFKTNIEWNVKTTLKKEDEFLKNILNEFDNLWKDSFEVNEEFLRNYEFFVNQQKEQTFIYKQKIKTNFMQKNALEKLEILRQKDQTKALNEKNIETPFVKNDRTSAWAQYSIRVQNRTELQTKLQNLGIPTAVHYPMPLHVQECFKYLNLKEGDFPISEKVSKEIMSLPMNPYVSDEEIEFIVENLAKELRC